jgi:hypothetical protein
MFRPKSTKEIYGNSGALIGSGHFNLDHDDITYETVYIMPSPILGVEVSVTQHSGSDSDRWLLHEIEDSYRDSDNENNRLGLLSSVGVKIREFGGMKFIYWGLGGGTYRWLCGQIVVEIKYKDFKRTKIEPIEIVQAYLNKYPSKIILIDLDLKSDSHNIQWIKDEMERRLWLCDKWNAQFQAGKVIQSKLLEELVDHMCVFLNYRQRYYNLPATADIETLSGYLENNDAASIQAKLSSYKAWWLANRAAEINL